MVVVVVLVVVAVLEARVLLSSTAKLGDPCDSEG